ncbi:MAG: CopG family transcriptional regulator [Acidimicrobiia bacterium]
MPLGLKEALRRESEATGPSEAELVREGIGLVTGSQRVAKPTLPIFESGIPDLAVRTDEFLEGFGER